MSDTLSYISSVTPIANVNGKCDNSNYSGYMSCTALVWYLSQLSCAYLVFYSFIFSSNTPGFALLACPPAAFLAASS